MARTHFSGPLDVTGGLADNNSQSGPSVVTQWWALRDPSYPYANGSDKGGNGWIGGGDFGTADLIPAAPVAAAIVAAATGTSGTAMTLVGTTGNGIFVNLPLVPYGSAIRASNVVRVTAIGPGHTTGDTSAASKTIANVGSTVSILPGTWICVPDGAAAGAPYIGQVASKTTTTLTMATAVPAAITGATIFLMDPTGTTVDCQIPCNGASFLDPVSGVGRGVSVTSNNAGDTGWTGTIVGYDVYRQRTTIAQAVSANAAVYSTKTLKFIASVTPSKSGGGNSTGTLSVGTSDVFGLPLRSSAWEHIRVYWAGALMTSSTGFVAADATNPATGATGAVRGTIQVATAGGGSGIGSNASNGSRRLVIYQNIPRSEERRVGKECRSRWSPY